MVSGRTKEKSKGYQASLSTLNFGTGMVFTPLLREPACWRWMRRV
jgi:hypothetical protein